MGGVRTMAPVVRPSASLCETDAKGARTVVTDVAPGSAEHSPNPPAQNHEGTTLVDVAPRSTVSSRICLSFHAMTLMGAEHIDEPTVEAIVAGGIPEDEDMKALVTAAKYAMAHKGIFLPRDKTHLATMVRREAGGEFAHRPARTYTTPAQPAPPPALTTPCVPGPPGYRG